MFLIVIKVLGGSWVVLSGVISRVTVIKTHIRGLITPFITTHEPPTIVRWTPKPYSDYEDPTLSPYLWPGGS